MASNASGIIRAQKLHYTALHPGATLHAAVVWQCTYKVLRLLRAGLNISMDQIVVMVRDLEMLGEGDLEYGFEYFLSVIYAWVTLFHIYRRYTNITGIQNQ